MSGMYKTLLLMTDFFFSTVLCNGNSGVIQAMLITKTEGEDFRDSFKVDQVGNSRLYLCKNNCSKEDILIETSGNRAQSGRYTVRYDGELYVTITELTQSDSGQYSFGVSNSSVLGSYKTFELRITGEFLLKVIDKSSIYSDPLINAGFFPDI